ncbi:MAG: hypothetical protein KAJ55_15345 [Anaerolineales bacterium]|nr:hypothetical protein [Anaerolineales bacterium]
MEVSTTLGHRFLRGRRWRELTDRERREFHQANFRTDQQRHLARRVIRDMAQASNAFYFSDEGELRTEIQRRVATARWMQESQRGGAANRAFGYPFRNPSPYWGPRVNYAAREYWEPAVPDEYSERRDPVRRDRIEELSAGRKYTVYGDPASGYSWSLTERGRADPYRAIITLFERQPPHRRTLIHCDYLVSLVHFRSLAETEGRDEFNRRLRSFGLRRIRLRWNAFNDLQMSIRMPIFRFPILPRIGSLRVVRPSSTDDLVIGDHVYFWNHEAYDLINRGVGNPWRLENAVLVDRRRERDLFQGHGSGQRTTHQMLDKLRDEYNRVAREALGLTEDTVSSSPTVRDQAFRTLSTRFPRVRQRRREWRVRGWNFGRFINIRLRTIRSDEVLGLNDPFRPTRMNSVRRPAESIE